MGVNMKFFFIAAALFFTNLAHAAQPEDLLLYYPMGVGNTWSYALNKKDPEEIVKITDCNNRKNEGCLHEHFLYNSIKLYNSFQYINNTVARTSSSNMLTGEFKKLNPPTIYLKSPVKIGTSWINIDKGETSKSMITAILQSFSVKAGDFNEVVVVETNIFEKNKLKWTKYEYYAPNVGMIKTEALRDKRWYTTRELIDYTIAR